MVKQTFYNLPFEKKQRIKDAIVKEIEQKSYEDISINQIVKNAGISRGSFYQYFDDKTDLLDLIMYGFSDELSEKCKRYMIESDGDAFKACEKVFDFVVDSAKTKNYSVAFKIIFSYTRTSDTIIHFGNNSQHETKSLLKEIKNYINCDLLLKKDEESLGYMATVILSVLTKLWFEIFVLSRDYKEVRIELSKIFDLLKSGFYVNNRLSNEQDL